MDRIKEQTSLIFRFVHWPLIARILVIIFVINITFGFLIHYIEPAEFPSIFDGIWWAIVTTATLGYGDYVPVTVTGRSLAIILILFGTGFVTTYFVSLAASAIATQNDYLEGKVDYRGSEHIIVIGWNERVRETLRQINSMSNKPLSIVLIDSTLEKNPLHDQNVHFIKGNPCYDQTLLSANVKSAGFVVISADQSKDEVQADMNSVLTLLAVKGLNPDVYTIAEILTSTQVINAQRAGADEVIQTNMFTSYVMTNSMMSNGMSNTLLTMLDQLKGSKLKYLEVEKDMIGTTFEKLSNQMLQKKILLIGIKRRGDTMVNPPLYTLIQADDCLLVIKD
ncbi:potassium channel family protein [Sutcliffiella horikoshii]|uniref:Ion transporter n=1 Tax=Sutcliffiella horikoshii TaxID=79883 RepID=A0A1Y0CR81_9BACI|nr:potassium channel family protein [Sutcliffiella horikoshii]ART77799.1 ion transporter [Sutcliffiella horikoshii]TYS60252.1 potassium channel family protein [Sutcliffiella horikoshii]